jgi:hypothetical protein
VAQRFIAAITGLFSVAASAAEVKMQSEIEFLRNCFSRAAKQYRKLALQLLRKFGRRLPLNWLSSNRMFYSSFTYCT